MSSSIIDDSKLQKQNSLISIPWIRDGNKWKHMVKSLDFCDYPGQSRISSVLGLMDSVSGSFWCGWGLIRIYQFRFHYQYCLLYQFLINFYWVLTGSTLIVTIISKQHIKGITFMQLTACCVVKCWCMLEVFPFFALISVGLITQKNKVI